MVKTDRSNLGYLGEAFQYRLIHTFMEDKNFFRDLCDILDQNMFTDPNLKTFVGVMREYYETEEAVPSYDMMEITLNEKARTDIERDMFKAVIEKIKETPSDGVEKIRDLSLRFFKQQNIVKTANKILSIAGNGDVEKYEQCVDLLQKALNQGVHDEYGSTVFDDLGETLSDDYRTPIPTGIDKIDEVLEGGLGKGELGVIIGPSSFGKTSLTTAIASFASTYKCEANGGKGYKVLQIVFEDRIKQIQRKHIGRITNVEAKDLSKPENIALIREQLEKYEDKDMLKENLRIVRFPSGEVTANALERYIKKLTNNGFRPDMVIVDYFECLKHVGDASSTNEYEKEGKTMRKLESMAGEMDMAFWIPTQGTKDSVSAELVTMDKAGGSFKKIQIAHIVMSIARTTEDAKNSKATIAILKNRAGKSGVIYNNVNFNNGTCRIDCSEVNEFDGLSAFNKEQIEHTQNLAQEVFKNMKSSMAKK